MHRAYRAVLVALFLAALLLDLPVAAAQPAAAPQVSAAPTVEQVFDALPSPAAPTYARLLTDNQEAWYARWWLVEHATTSIDAVYFQVNDEVFGHALLGLLIKKARAGLPIRLLVDARGTTTMSRQFLSQDLLQELAEAGNVQIKVFNPVSAGLVAALAHLDLRQTVASNHDKLLVVDGEWLVTGGRNISWHYFGSPEDSSEVWRDTDVLLRGVEVARQARAAFDVEWAQLRTWEVPPDRFGNWKSRAPVLELSRRLMSRHLQGLGPLDAASLPYPEVAAEVLEELGRFPRLRGYAGFEPLRGERPYPTKLLDKTAIFGHENAITPSLVALMDAAREEILIENPYVILTDTARAALKRASDRGVPVVIVTNSPDSSDSLMTQALFVREWKEVLRDLPTCRIFAFKGEHKLHAKVFVFDSKVAVVGTYNMDDMSESINSEDVAVIKSGPFATQNRLRIRRDMDDCVEYRIAVDRETGEVREVVGPSSHCQEKAMKTVERLGKLAFLRPLI